MWRDAKSDENGQILMLIIGFGIAIIFLIAMVVDASSAFLRQRDVRGVADGASLAATDALDTGSVYEGDLDGGIRLDRELAEQKVDEYASNTDSTCDISEFSQTRVTVRCSAVAKLPFSGSVAPDLGVVRINAVSTSQSISN